MSPLFSLLLLVGIWTASVDAQLVNGQFFTKGLAISNAPAPNSEFTVGGNIAVSVDVSGNGRLPSDSWGPNSQLETGFISLSLFLISNNHNVTIVNGATGDFLAGEPGSTVKHLNYVIPSCLEAGSYDYTYYEVSRMNGTTYFAITPISIQIKNPQGSSGNCDPNVTNPVLQRPQNDSAAPVNPFTGGLTLDTSGSNTNANPNTALSSPTRGTSMQDQVPTVTPSTAKSFPTMVPNTNAQAAFNADLTFPIRRISSSSASSVRLHSIIRRSSKNPKTLKYYTGSKSHPIPLVSFANSMSTLISSISSFTISLPSISSITWLLPPISRTFGSSLILSAAVWTVALR